MASQIDTFDSLEVWRQKINPYLQTTSNVAKDSIRFQNQTTGSTSTDGFLIGLVGSDGRIWNHENAIIKFGTSDVERMRLDSSGRLLIGAASVLGSETLRVYNASNSRVVIDHASSGLVLGSDASGPFIDTTTATRLAIFVGGTERMRIDPTGSLQIKTPVAMGYGTGSGGAVTQATSRTTGVTINKPAGSITLVSAAGSTAWQTFTVTNSTVSVDDIVHVVQRSGTDKYQIHVTNVAAGSFQITFATTGGTTTEQPVFNFNVMNGAVT